MNDSGPLPAGALVSHCPATVPIQVRGRELLHRNALALVLAHGPGP